MFSKTHCDCKERYIIDNQYDNTKTLLMPT